MKKLMTDSKQFGLLRLLDEFAAATGVGLSDQAAPDEFIKGVSAALKEHRSNPILIHGFRAQTMFAYVASALGGCKIINEEDSGDFYVRDAGLKRPDFRVLSDEGREFFVEVKNFKSSKPLDPFVLDADYARNLEKYASAFQKPLLFAVYWVSARLWTLNPLADFSFNDEAYSLSILEALKNDQMGLLGDCLVGIPKPFALRFYTEPTKPRTMSPDGRVRFTINRAAFVAAGREIIDKFEERLAWFFLWFGSWEDMEQTAHTVDGEVIYFEMKGVRDDPNPDQQFLMIGNLSQMIVRQFNFLTVHEGKVERLVPKVQPEKLGVVIPAEFRGDVLGIWRFRMQPDRPTFDTPNNSALPHVESAL
jgi:hypothetical protein